jgi:aryl-alcohol dehydrogenase-like predicted oxidoreductase
MTLLHHGLHQVHPQAAAGFAGGRPTQAWLDRLAALREVLTSDGSTLAPGALAYLWARSPVTIPIPEFKTVAQVEDNCGDAAARPAHCATARRDRGHPRLSARLRARPGHL